MRKTRRQRLERLGYKITDTREFLGLSKDEIALIDLKISLIKKLKEARRNSKLTQRELAKLMGSSQSRVAMLESAAPDVSLDLICKALFVLGVSKREIGRAIATKEAA